MSTLLKLRGFWLLLVVLVITLVSMPLYFRRWLFLTVQHAANGHRNPGCQERTLSAYNPSRVARKYHHPSIVHYAKFHPTPNGKFSVTFLEYLSILSVHNVLNPEKIMIHSNAKFEGKYWSLIQRWTDTPVTINKMDRVTHFGKEQIIFIEHEADYAKISQVFKHGGVALDFDVIFVNSTMLNEAQRFSECVVVREEDAIRMSFFSCAKNATFMKTMMESYHNDYNPGWVYNAGHVPTMLLVDKSKSDCFNVFVDRTICSPTYGLAHDLWLKPFGVDWRTKIAAHYYRRKLLLTKEDESLLEGNSSLSDLLRNAYKPSQST